MWRQCHVSPRHLADRRRRLAPVVPGDYRSVNTRSGLGPPGKERAKAGLIMSEGILSKLRRICGAVALTTLSATGASVAPAVAQDSLANFSWPENPFAPTLSDALFIDTGENRFEKAGRVLVQSLGGVGDELADIFTFPVRDPATLGTYALGIGALILVDKQTTTFYQKTVVPIGEKITFASPVGFPFIFGDGEIIVLGLAGTYAFGVLANDERSQVAALLASKAVAYSYLTSHVILKTAFGRLRPVDDLENHTGPTGDFTTSPYQFLKSTGIHFDSHAYATGMPSFHFTMYFSTARVYSGVYDNYVIPYGIAAALALGSAEGHNHWVSDMVAGALIGTAIGNVILNNYEDRRSDINASFMPIASSKGVGVGFQMSF